MKKEFKDLQKGDKFYYLSEEKNEVFEIEFLGMHSNSFFNHLGVFCNLVNRGFANHPLILNEDEYKARCFETLKEANEDLFFKLFMDLKEVSDLIDDDTIRENVDKINTYLCECERDL